MNALLDSFWRAAAYCLHPKVMLLSLLPLLISGAAAWALGYFYWEAAVAGVRSTMESWAVLSAMLAWLDSIGGSGFRNMLAPLLVVALAVPLILIFSLLVVAALMTPALVNLVAARRFPWLERKHGAPVWQGVLWSLWCTLGALVLLVLSMPLWFIPPLVLLLPPLIWGWLTYRVFSFDVLADHATREERQHIVREYRFSLLGMGVLAGYLGAAPSLLWALSAMTLVLAPVLVLFSVWIYTLVFAFTALWFAHFLLGALKALRAARAVPPAAPSAEPLQASPPLVAEPPATLPPPP